jgi:CBS domain containing-hemolysin-like protein
MTLALVLVTLAAIPVLALVTFVQMLYLESMRLRPRDLPSVRFFKETLEDRLGFETEYGAGVFSIIKHTLLVLLGVLFLACEAGSFWEAALGAWIAMLAAAYVVPQLLYRRTSAQWLLPLAPLLHVLAWPARPLAAVMVFFQSLIDLTDGTGQKEEEPTPAENIDALISAGAEEGLIEEQDRKLIQSVVEFGDKVVREVMTPRPNIVAIPADSTLEQLRQLVITEQYSRVPAFEQNIDQIIGFVHVRDMFELKEDERAGRSVRDLLRPLMFVPETKPVHSLMRQMQQENTHMVIVVDEYGNTAGLATMEDLLEVIIGEIRDEHEPSTDVTDEGNGRYVVSGSFELDRLSHLLESFRREEDIESTTVGGLVSEWLGRVPKPGEWVDRDGVRIEVLAGDGHRVDQVRICKSESVAL